LSIYGLLCVISGFTHPKIKSDGYKTITHKKFDARLAQSTEQVRQKRLALEA